MLPTPAGYEYLLPTEAAAEFAKDWDAALNPSFEEWADRCHPELRDEATDLMLDHISECETPPYSPVQMRRLAEKVAPIIDKAFDDPEHKATMQQWRSEFRALPWYVRRQRRIRLAVFLYWMKVKYGFRTPRWM